MKLSLDQHLKSNATSGRTQVELRGPDGSVVFLGAYHETLAQELHDLAAQDAATLAGPKLVYVVWCKSEDGRSSSRYPLELSGGRDSSDASPDAHTLTRPEAAFGHIVRLCIDTNKQLRELARDVQQSRSGEVHDLRMVMAKYVRLMSQKGEESLLLKALDIEESRAKAKGDALGRMVDGAMPLLAGVIARAGLLPAGPVAGSPGAANATDSFFESLTPEQGEQFFAILGPARAARVLRARGSSAAREIMTVLLTETTQEEQAALVALLRPEQVQKLKGLMTTVEQQVDKEAEKAKANGAAAHTNGVTP